jgi:hypothetical protein
MVVRAGPLCFGREVATEEVVGLSFPRPSGESSGRHGSRGSELRCRVGSGSGRLWRRCRGVVEHDVSRQGFGVEGRRQGFSVEGCGCFVPWLSLQPPPFDGSCFQTRNQLAGMV